MADKQMTCAKCGAVYEVTNHKVIFRDQDSFSCECGEELDSWSSSVIPQFKLIAHGNSPKTKGK